MVIWLLGISGAGKSTLGIKLKEHFDSLNRRAYLLDGDVVRSFYNNDLGYSVSDRKQNIKRILLAAHVLEQSGTIAIVCNISPFEELRTLAREKLDCYIQIYLNKSIKAAREADIKNVYRDNRNVSHIVGIDMSFEEPMTNELVLDTDHEDSETSFLKILNYLRERSGHQL